MAAPSTFPLLWSPLTLKNHPPPQGYRVPREMENTGGDYGINRRRYQWVANRIPYLEAAERP